MYHRLKYTNNFQEFARENRLQHSIWEDRHLEILAMLGKLNDRRHTVRYLAEITGCRKPTLHMILKSDLKLSKASARWDPRFLSVNDGKHNPASYN